MTTVGTLSAPTYRGEMLRRELARPKRLRQKTGRGDGVGDGQVDADTADRRHGVCGIADAEQPVAVPPAQAVKTDVEDLDVIPRRDGLDRRFGDQLGEFTVERVEPTRPQLRVASFGNQVGDLEVALARDHDQRSPGSGAWDQRILPA